MSIVITGGTGFVGLALTEALLPLGHKVVLFGRDRMPQRFADVLQDCSFQNGDITSPAALDVLLEAVRPDAIVHLAAVTPDRNAEMQDPAAVVAINVGGTANLLRAVSRLKRRPRVLLASSVAVYGETLPMGTAYKEADDIPAPHSLYGITKLSAENVASRLAELYEIDLTVVRLGPVYGPWEYKTGLRPVLSPHAQVVDLWRRGEEVVLPRRLAGDWLYSRDAGRGLTELLLADRLENKLYNFGGEVVTDVAQWCALLENEAWAHGWRIAAHGETPNVLFGLTRDRAPLDVTRIVEDIGFQSRRNGRAAAADYLSWLAAFGMSQQ